MSLRQLADGSPAPADLASSGFLPESVIPQGPPRFLPPRPDPVMPAGGDVDVDSVLGPLIDGSFSMAQGQAAVMAGVRGPQANGGAPGTNPLRGTAPLGGTDGLPNGYVPRLVVQVPPHLVHGMVQRVLMGLPPSTQLVRTPDVEQMLTGRFMDALGLLHGELPPGGQEALYHAVMDDILGLGPLEPLLRDDSISEVMVNAPDQVWVERAGQMIESSVKFLDEEHVTRVAQRIVAPLGRRLDRKWPMVDARLPDGSRVNIIIPPCAIHGTTITIRKFFKTPLTVDNLISFGTLTRPMADFLRACVAGRVNAVVSGGTGSGKTTLLNVLSSFIPESDRIVTIEDSAELRLNQRHVVSLEAKPADMDGEGAVTIRHLVVNALRMRPERIVVGECRSGEALDMLQAMNTGHDGSLTTLHANAPRDALSRLETMVMMSGLELPVRVIREQVASAIDLIIQQARLRDGSRKITYITEVQGMEGDTIVLQDIFRFHETGSDPQGRVLGKLQATGLVPNFVRRLEATGARFDRSLFDR